MLLKYQRNPQTAGRIIDGLAFIVTPDDNKLHTLNATATRLWVLAKDGCTVEDAASDLAERYQVAAEQALEDTRVCFQDLVARSILIKG